MSIRITGFAALVAAMLLATGASSQATYTLTTSVGTTTGLTAASPATLAPGGTFILNTTGGPVTITATNGGNVYTDAAGSTIYLLNDEQTGGGIGVTNEQIFANLVAGDASNFNFTVLIAVNGLAAFTESIAGGYTVNGGFLIGGTASVSPGSITQTPLTVTSIGAAANSGAGNSVSNPSVSATFNGSTIPEPASVVMLGLGLLSVGGVALRRRMAK